MERCYFSVDFSNQFLIAYTKNYQSFGTIICDCESEPF
jgi:hypothetical protein